MVDAGALTFAKASAGTETAKIRTGQRWRIGSISCFKMLIRKCRSKCGFRKMRIRNPGPNGQAPVRIKRKPRAKQRNPLTTFTCYGLGGKKRPGGALCVKLIA